MSRRNWIALFVFLIVTFAASGIAGMLTTPEIGGWYAGLEKPAFNPPNWVFGPVWTSLYLLIAVSGWLAWRAGGTGTSVLWTVQLALNFLWSILFFALHRPDLALLLAAIVGCIVVFRRCSQAAAWLLAPYLLWTLFAALLNFRIWQLN